MKYCLTLVIVTIFSFTSSALDGIKLNVVVQPQISTINGDFYASYMGGIQTTDIVFKKETTFKMAFGVQSIFQFTEKSGLGVGLMYSGQGQDYEDLNITFPYGATSTIQYSTSINYFKIPLTYEYQMHPDRKLSFSFYAGTYFGLMLDNEVSSYGESLEPQSGETSNWNIKVSGTSFVEEAHISGFDLYDSEKLTSQVYESFDIGGVIGAGAIFKVTDKISIPFYINYEYGFVDIKNTASKFDDSFGDNWYWEGYSAKNMTTAFHNSVLGFRTGISIKL
jgi:hypothetical protein